MYPWIDLSSQDANNSNSPNSPIVGHLPQGVSANKWMNEKMIKRKQFLQKK